MAIVLIIIGLVSGITLPLMTLQNQRSNITRTREHQEYVMQALASFLIQNKRLPCPADPKADITQFGLEVVSCAKSKTFQGIVPFRTLGISEKWVKDGFGHYMTYAPEPNLVKDFFTEFEQICLIPGGSLKLTNSAGNSVVSDLNKQPLTVILVSHGPDGRGSFLGQGQSSRSRLPELQAAKLENANGDSTFSEYINSADEEYDDIVRWEALYPFMAYYVKQPCTPTVAQSAPKSNLLSQDKL